MNLMQIKTFFFPDVIEMTRIDLDSIEIFVFCIIFYLVHITLIDERFLKSTGSS